LIAGMVVHCNRMKVSRESRAANTQRTKNTRLRKKLSA
jgi:hypothetical protein